MGQTRRGNYVKENGERRMSEIYVETYCYCDECGKKLLMHDETRTSFLRRARLAYRWTFGKYIKCINCRPDREELIG